MYVPNDQQTQMQAGAAILIESVKELNALNLSEEDYRAKLATMLESKGFKKFGADVIAGLVVKLGQEQ